MNRKLTAAMVGGGAGAFIGPVHRMALRLGNFADVVAGTFNRDAAQNAQTGRELFIAPERIYPDWQTMLQSEAKRPDRVDFVIVCTPNHLHHAITKASLEAGFDVMCEKPLTLTVAEAEELAALAKKKRRVIGLMHTYSGYPMVKLARDLVKNGSIGKVCKVVVEYQQGSFRKLDFSVPLDKRNKWKMDPKYSGISCCMGDIGIHAAHLVEYVTGLEIREVLAELSSYVAPAALDDDGSVLLRLSKGARGVMVSSKIATGEENGLRLKIYGEKRGLFWYQENPNYLRVAAQREPEQTFKRGNPYVREISPAAARAANVPAGHPEGYIEGFVNIYRNFCGTLEARRERRKPTELELDFPDARAGIRGMKFVEAAVKSSQAGGVWVTL
ncbi:MAG: Gfo/Idh/MocA family oxidoreductase [Kiritimatiellae bacterium]|nr:Gfo/Idh/MocA family oxidoreductase [Kiritimatiellia bacterium]